MIKDLREINRWEVDQFGGKATNLGFLIQNGFNVPKGFCISTAISEIPNEIKKEVYRRFQLLDSAVSVRSSATCEDSEKLSFAGQFDTFLNINTKEQLYESIQKCWDSINSDRVKIYLRRRGIPIVKMAVIIQKMIDADISGILFTLDPVNKKHILIEAAHGSGDNIVSGRITPSNFLVRHDFSIVSQKNDYNIDEELVKEIAKIGIKIENLYKKPQDVEFAVKNKEIFILQSRAITNL